VFEAHDSNAFVPVISQIQAIRRQVFVSCYYTADRFIANKPLSFLIQVYHAESRENCALFTPILFFLERFCDISAKIGPLCQTTRLTASVVVSLPFIRWCSVDA
jgi:hypothetical protein